MFLCHNYLLWMHNTINRSFTSQLKRNLRNLSTLTDSFKLCVSPCTCTFSVWAASIWLQQVDCGSSSLCGSNVFAWLDVFMHHVSVCVWMDWAESVNTGLNANWSLPEEPHPTVSSLLPSVFLKEEHIDCSQPFSVIGKAVHTQWLIPILQSRQR